MSVATVSRALNGQKHVRTETRERVEQVAQELGYQPNGLARALRRERTMLIGLIVPDVRSEFFASSTALVQAALEPSGYRVILGVSHDDADIDRSYLIEMVQRRVDGIIHVPCTSEGAAFVTKFPQGPPIVELNRRSGGRHADTVVADDRAGIAQLTRHLVELGHRDIGFIGGWPPASTTRERVAGFTEAVGEAGLEDRARIVSREYSVDWGREAALALLGERRPPTALVASNTQLTAGALQAVAERGLRTPDDVSLVGFDDPPWFTAVQPAITTYADPLEEMSMRAVELLLDRIAHPDARKRRVHAELPGRLIMRGSTARIRRRRPRADPSRLASAPRNGAG
jgi:LacI family transcriptional regulator, galactose operon repressor